MRDLCRETSVWMKFDTRIPISGYLFWAVYLWHIVVDNSICFLTLWSIRRHAIETDSILSRDLSGTSWPIFCHEWKECKLYWQHAGFFCSEQQVAASILRMYSFGLPILIAKADTTRPSCPYPSGLHLTQSRSLWTRPLGMAQPLEYRQNKIRQAGSSAERRATCP